MTLQDKNAQPIGKIQIQVRSVGRQEIIPPKVTPKTDPSFSAQFQRIVYATYSFQECSPQKENGFYSDGSRFIVDIYTNEHWGNMGTNKENIIFLLEILGSTKRQ